MTRVKQTNKTTTITNNNDEDVSLDVARDCYFRVMRALNRSANYVEQCIDVVVDEKELTSLERNLLLHHKMLGNVFNLKGGLNGHGSKSESSKLDLDAARAEIVERLSRIQNAS